MSYFIDDRGHLEVGRITKLAFSAVVVIVALIIVFGSFIIVPAGTRGVVLTWSAKRRTDECADG